MAAPRSGAQAAEQANHVRHDMNDAALSATKKFIPGVDASSIAAQHVDDLWPDCPALAVLFWFCF
jgi:hypothetical protein